jgi:rhodanese-related sulfurtransferase
MRANTGWSINHLGRSVYLLLVLLLAVSTAACNTEKNPAPKSTPKAELPIRSTATAVLPRNPEATRQLTTPTLAADSVLVPSDMIERIQIEDLQTMIDNGESLAILDVREVEYYRISHIQGAISFPWKPALSDTDLEMIPSRDVVVVYCRCGPGEADAANIAWQLVQSGIENIKVLAHPSIEGWIAADYPTESSE